MGQQTEEGQKAKRKAYAAAWHKANVERVNAASTTWQKANPEKAKASSSAWRKANPEKVNARNAAWKKANPEKVRAAKRRRYHSNPEKARAACSAWQKANPEAGRRRQHNRRANKEANGGKLSPGISIKLLSLQRGKCAVCKKSLKKVGFHLDHIVPLSRGGKNVDGNIQLACPACNIEKGSRDPIAFMQSRGFLL